MRNAPVAIYYCRELPKLLKYSYRQSKTTHQVPQLLFCNLTLIQGEEAADCCKLQSYVIAKAILQGDGTTKILDAISKEELGAVCYSVECLSQSIPEQQHPSNKKLHLEDRNWNWKDPNFKWSSSRTQENPGYIGSYAMVSLLLFL